MSYGHNVQIANTFQKNKGQIETFVNEGLNAVVITTLHYTVLQNDPVQEIISFVRTIDPEIPIIVGGPKIFMHCELSSHNIQNSLFRRLGADVYLVEEKGLASLEMLVDAFAKSRQPDLSKIPNLVFKTVSGDFIRTSKKCDNTSINDYAVNWKHFSAYTSSTIAYMQTKRGCSFKCAFCNYHKFVKSFELKHIELIKNEMDDLYAMGTRLIMFTDDTFNVPSRHFKEILNLMIEQGYDFKWFAFIRVANLDRETIDLMVRSGCLCIFAGIDSGDQQILNNMNKKAKVDRYAENLDLLNDKGIWTHASLIVGFPGETEGSVLNTVKLMQEHPPTSYDIHLYFHDLIADIASRKQEYEIRGEMYSWQHHTMNWQQAVYWQEYMIKNINRSCYAPNMGFVEPILLHKGFSAESVKKLLNHLKPVLINGLNGESSNKFRVECDKLAELIVSENMKGN
jgi:p-methyltransferase